MSRIFGYSDTILMPICPYAWSAARRFSTISKTTSSETDKNGPRLESINTVTILESGLTLEKNSHFGFDDCVDHGWNFSFFLFLIRIDLSKIADDFYSRNDASECSVLSVEIVSRHEANKELRSTAVRVAIRKSHF